MKVPQLCLIPCNPMDCTVRGVLQARILEWVAFPFSRGSSQKGTNKQTNKKPRNKAKIKIKKKLKRRHNNFDFPKAMKILKIQFKKLRYPQIK